MSWISGVYECCSCHAWLALTSHCSYLYRLWLACRWWPVKAQTRSCHACFNFSCLCPGSLTLHSGSSLHNITSVHEIFECAHLKFNAPGTYVYTHTHTLAQCSPTGVVLVSLASINNLSCEPNVMIKCPDPLNVLRNGSTHLANFDRYVRGSLIGYAYDNVLKSYTATGDWVFVL